MEEKPQKKVFITEKISRMFSELRTYTKTDRFQYRTDVKALLCRGIDEKEQTRIKNAVMTEDAMFYASRTYVPLALFRLYR